MPLVFFFVFPNLYSSSMNSMLNLHASSGLPNIKQHDWVVLNKPVSMDEGRKALFSMRSYKSPGPDGFKPLFLNLNRKQLVNRFLAL